MIGTSRYGWRAHAQHDFLAHGVAVYLGHETNGRATRLAVPAHLELQDVGDSLVQAEPWLRLNDDIAQALMDALAAHYGGHTHLLTLRADYEAERDRLDKLIDLLTLPPASATR